MAPFECLLLSHLKFSLIPLQEKEHSIPHDDLGRDVASVTALQRKHEAFENEASALGTQVRVGVAVMAMVWIRFLHPSTLHLILSSTSLSMSTFNPLSSFS